MMPRLSPGAIELARRCGIAGVITAAQVELRQRGRIRSIRYLAEVAWAPDAIMANRDLRWCDHGPSSLTVSAGKASVMLTLDEDGLIAQAFAPDRPRSTPNGMIPTPWRGKFWDYRQIGDRMIPHSANVSWTVDGSEQVYGEFKLTDWRLLPGN